MSKGTEMRKIVERRPYLVLGCVFLISIFMAYGITKLPMTTDFSKFIPEEHPTIKTKLAFENEFTQVSYAWILIDGENVTKAKAIHAILELKSSIVEDPELENFVTRVEAYTDYIIPIILQMNNNMLPPDPQLEAAVQSLLHQPQIEKQVVGKLLTEDQKAALVSISIKKDLSGDERRKVIDSLNKHTDNFNGSDENLQARLTGDIIIREDIYRMMNRDNSVLIPAAIILVVIILFLVFKRFSDIFVAFLVVGLGALWAVGIMGYLGLDFTVFHVALVPLLIGLGVDYSIHMLNRYYEERGKGKPANKAIQITMITVGIAVVISTLTTMIGFGSFVTSPLVPFRTLGVFAALGILFMFILSLTILPAIIILRDRRGAKKINAIVVKRGKSVDRVLSTAAVGAERYGKFIAVIAIILAVACAVSAIGISSTMSIELFLPSHVESVATINAINEKFGGQSIIFVLVKGDVTSPQGLREMLEFENLVLGDPNNSGKTLITHSLSLADVISEVAGGQIPENPYVITGIIDNLNPSLRGRLLSDNQAIIYFYVNAKTDKDSEKATNIIRSNVNEFSSEVLDMKIDGEPAVSGDPVVITDIIESITPTVFNSTFLTILICFAILAILFKSAVTGFIVLMPLLLTLSWEFGTLRILGWSLDVLTMGISALIIGLGVDYSVHVTHRFREERAKKNPEEAVRATVMNIGTAMLAAAATTIGVFAILSLSGMPAMGRFGSLTALVIFYGLVAALVILPSVLVLKSFWKRK